MTLLKSTLIVIKSLLFYVFDSLALFNATPPKKNKFELVLLVRQDAIGDFIMWLDTAKEYRQLYPPNKYKIVLIGNELWCSLAETLPYWDEVFPINVSKFKTISIYRMKVLFQITNLNSKIAIQPTFSREFYNGDALVRASKASKKISSVGDMGNRNRLKQIIADRWHTELIPASQKLLTELERNAEFFSNLSNYSHNTNYPKLEINNSWFMREWEKEKFYVLVPGTSGAVVGKDWPPKYFADLSNKIFHHTRLKGVICGAKKEYDLGEMILKQSNVPLENLCGQTTLPNLAGLLSQSLLTISNDTGIVYLSSAIGTSSICILGGGHFGRFVPFPELPGGENKLTTIFHKMPCYGCDWKCIYSIKEGESVPCISNISVDAVWSKLLPLLQKDESLNLLSNNTT